MKTAPSGWLSRVLSHPATSGTREAGRLLTAVRVRAGPGATVERLDRGHVTGGEREVEYVDVLPDPRRSDRLRNDDVSQLDVPAQDDLRRGLAVPARQRGDHRVSEDIPLGQRTPRLRHDAVRPVERTYLLLLESRMQLHLIDRGHDPAPVQKGLQMPRLEVRHANRPGPSARADLFERLPGVEVDGRGRYRPVDQVEVDVVQSEPAQAPVECAERRFV